MTQQLSSRPSDKDRRISDTIVKYIEGKAAQTLEKSKILITFLFMTKKVSLTPYTGGAGHFFKEGFCDFALRRGGGLWVLFINLGAHLTFLTWDTQGLALFTSKNFFFV